MKELARYLGKVINLVPDSPESHVVLTEVGTDKSSAVTAQTKALLDANLKTGDEFEIIIQQSIDGNVSGVINAMPAGSMIPDHIKKIHADLAEKFPPNARN